MTHMTGGSAIVKSLRQYGIDTLFGIPGAQLDYLFNALYDERKAIRVIANRHEQLMSFRPDNTDQVPGRAGRS